MLQKLLIKTIYTLKITTKNNQEIINKCLCKTYEILCALLGSPPTHYDVDIENNEGSIIRMKQCSPQYLLNLIQFNIDDYVYIQNDPRYTFDKKYSKKYTESMIGYQEYFLNVDISRIKNLIIESLKENRGVYTECDVMHCSTSISIFSKDYDLSNVFSLPNDLDKKTKLKYKFKRKMHAVVITSVNIEKESSFIHGWEVENSWSHVGPSRGYYHMEPDWFDENVYSIVVHKTLLNQKERHILLDPNITIIDDIKTIYC